MMKNREYPHLSAEIFSIPLDEGRFLIYAPLRRAAFVGNAQTVNFLASLQEGDRNANTVSDDSLIELLRRLEILDAGDETLPIINCTGIPEPTALTLFLTTSCNLRCTYCYASAGEAQKKYMPMNVAKRGIDYVIANAVRKKTPSIEINFHGGGEPTVNWQTMTGSLLYARDRCDAENITVAAFSATNGMLTDKQIDWMIANLQGASVSFDGLPEVHDAYRKTISGKGSSNRVMHTLHRFDEAGFDYGIRVTVTADHISKMADSIDFICSRFRTPHIQVEPAYQIGKWKNAPSAETREFVAGFRKAQERAHIHGKAITYSAARAGLLTNHFCKATQDSFALSPDGNVSSCFEAFSEQQPLADVFFYGKPAGDSDGYLFDRERVENLRNQSVEKRAYCSGCFAKWSCAGDCYYKNLTANGGSGNEAFTGTDRCYITRELTIDQLLERISDAGGLFWHEAPPENTAIL